MRIGLIDVDGHSGFPNLALMKLSAWHKANGDSVEWYEPLFAVEPFDRVYMSKVFTFTPDYPYPVNATEISMGGYWLQTVRRKPSERDREHISRLLNISEISLCDRFSYSRMHPKLPVVHCAEKGRETPCGKHVAEYQATGLTRHRFSR